MPRPRKPDKLAGNLSVKLDSEDKSAIEKIIRQEGGDKSKVVRALIKAGLEARDVTLQKGSRLGLTLLERMRRLDLRRQYDLLAIADALLERQAHDQTSEVGGGTRSESTQSAPPGNAESLQPQPGDEEDGEPQVNIFSVTTMN